jgi:hypothetical protein
MALTDNIDNIDDTTLHYCNVLALAYLFGLVSLHTVPGTGAGHLQ